MCAFKFKFVLSSLNDMTQNSKVLGLSTIIDNMHEIRGTCIPSNVTHL